MIFFIEGTTKEIFGVGFRPAIMGSAAEIGLKSAVSNIPDKNKVQVLVSGSHNMITSFHQQIKNNDIRIKTNHKPKYNVTDAQEYEGPNIDWNGYQLSMMAEQMYKGFLEANKRLGSIESKLTKKKPIKSAKKGRIRL
ncbi:MAG: acylphosphatase [Candidatus Nitrosopolaris sp.]